jgi:hypothetical protein
MEASFCGSDNLPSGGFHYNTNHLKEMGHQFGKTLYEYFSPELLEAAASSVENSLSSVSTAVDQHAGSAGVTIPLPSSDADTLMDSKMGESKSTKLDIKSARKMSIKALSEKLKEEVLSGNPEFAQAERYDLFTMYYY